MAIATIAHDGGKVLGRLLQRVARGSALTDNATNQRRRKSNLNISQLKNRIWYTSDTPTVTMSSYLLAPVAIGDLVYDDMNDEAYICSVSVAAATCAAFIKLGA